jgi:translation initiation factor IF-3
MRKSYKFIKKKKIEPIKYRCNFQISAPEVQVIDDTGQHLGTMTTKEAIAKAHEQSLDLVEVAPTAKPPVVKFIDFGKFQYQQEKLMRKQKSKAKKVEVKGIRLSAKISDHDLTTKANQASAFLEDGQKVKIELILRGRENQHTELAKILMQNFTKQITIPFQIEQNISKQGNKLIMIILPDSKS